jgi:DNA invertase Pin-like site-specific DNA recombinase
MSGPQTISRRHLDRLAIVYVRQSTLMQVRQHTESTARQYALAEEAARLGWPASAIVTIDADLGLSGRGASGRTGFKEVVSRVCLGEVGAVFGLEISRFARSSADLQRLLEFCSLSDTLIVDADGVYDLRNFNDRLLLGLKGTMSEAELHILAGRLQESKRAAGAAWRSAVSAAGLAMSPTTTKAIPWMSRRDSCGGRRRLRGVCGDRFGLRRGRPVS